MELDIDIDSAAKKVVEDVQESIFPLKCTFMMKIPMKIFPNGTMYLDKNSMSVWITEMKTVFKNKPKKAKPSNVSTSQTVIDNEEVY